MNKTPHRRRARSPPALAASLSPSPSLLEDAVLTIRWSDDGRRAARRRRKRGDDRQRSSYCPCTRQRRLSSAPSSLAGAACEDETLAEAHRRHSATHVRQCARMCKQWPAFTLRQPAGCFCWASCGTFQSSNYWKGRAVTYLQHANQSLLSPNHSFLLHQRASSLWARNSRQRADFAPKVVKSWLKVQYLGESDQSQGSCSSTG